MDNYMEFIKPELLALIPALYCLGLALKQANAFRDNKIPLVLGAAGVALALMWVLATAEVASWQGALLAVFTGAVQGILCAGTAVFGNQLYKQSKK